MALILMPSFDDATAGSSWVSGDVIDVLEDGVHPGTAIVNGDWLTGTVIDPKFWLIHCVDGTKAQVEALVDRVAQVDENGVLVNVRQRAKRLDYQTLSQPIKRALNRDHRYDVTLAQIASLLSNKA